MKSKRDDVIKYGKNKYGASPDYPWAKYPNYAVLRHNDSDKWFALVMDVPKNKIGLDGDEVVDILDIKCDPDEIGGLRQQGGFLPAYHMNKEHWVSVLLDGTVPDDEIRRLIDKSYEFTA